jgi:hypothetical protein
MVVLIPGEAARPRSGLVAHTENTQRAVVLSRKYLPVEESQLSMGRHTPLTDAQRAAVADRAVEQVADTLFEMHDGSTQSGQRKPLSADDTSGHRT